MDPDPEDMYGVCHLISALWTYYVGRGDPLARLSLTQVCAFECVFAWLYKWVALSLGSRNGGCSTPLSWQICQQLHYTYGTPHLNTSNLIADVSVSACIGKCLLRVLSLTSHLIQIHMQVLDPLTFEECFPVSATSSSTHTLSIHRRSMGRLERCQTELRTIKPVTLSAFRAKISYLIFFSPLIFLEVILMVYLKLIYFY